MIEVEILFEVDGMYISVSSENRCEKHYIGFDEVYKLVQMDDTVTIYYQHDEVSIAKDSKITIKNSTYLEKFKKLKEQGYANIPSFFQTVDVAIVTWKSNTKFGRKK